MSEIAWDDWPVAWWWGFIQGVAILVVLYLIFYKIGKWWEDGG